MGIARVEPISISANRQEVRYVAPGSEPVSIWVEADVPLVTDLTPWVALLVPVAARQGHDLMLEGPVDPVALKNAGAALEVLHGWFPRELASISASAASTSQDREPAAGVGCFFSGGVDSFYSVVRQRERLTHLCFVHGFDVKIGDEALASRVRDQLVQAADEFGLPLVNVTTNIRVLSDSIGLAWDWHFHGAALGGIAQMLGRTMRIMVVPSGKRKDALNPWGTHSSLDPLWSSGTVIVEHDVEVDRTEKVRRIAEEPLAMQHLRVCWRNPDGAYNCGKCIKCMLTMISLWMVGAEGRCSTLPATIDLDLLAEMVVSRHTLTWQVVQDALPVASQADPAFAAALRSSIRRSKWMHRRTWTSHRVHGLVRRLRSLASA